MYFVVRIRCRRKNFTFAILSADELLVFFLALAQRTPSD